MYARLFARLLVKASTVLMTHSTTPELFKILEEEFDEEVVQTFRQNKIDIDTLLELTSEDMQELGIVALGDRKRLTKLINRLSTELENPASSGVIVS